MNVLFSYCTAQDIHVSKASHLGWLINQAFHDFELTVPVLPTQVTIGAQSLSNYLTAEDPYAGFNAQIQQILSEADALHNEVDRQGLKEVLHKYKFFAKNSLGCGLTNIHTVRIPTNPNAPTTFVRQYKIPIASYEPVQEIVDSMLEKGVIRPCNSTYSAPIWPILKPNGKWRPTIDYRKLNQHVPL